MSTIEQLSISQDRRHDLKSDLSHKIIDTINHRQNNRIIDNATLGNLIEQVPNISQARQLLEILREANRSVSLSLTDRESIYVEVSELLKTLYNQPSRKTIEFGNLNKEIEAVREKLQRAKLASVPMTMPLIQQPYSFKAGSTVTNQTTRSSADQAAWTGPPPTNKSSVADKIRYMVHVGETEGYCAEVIAGIIGNIMKEATKNMDTNPPTAKEIRKLGHHYTGLVQWAGSRIHDLRRFAAKQGKSEYAFSVQVAFIFKELRENKGYGAKELKDLATKRMSPREKVALATKIFCDKYERPAAAYAKLSVRQQFAAQAYTDHIATRPTRGANLPPQETEQPQEMVYYYGEFDLKK